jgi:hypothetical protein
MAANTKNINDDAKKIAFVLSYVKAGTTLKMAESWKNHFVKKVLMPSKPPPLPTYEEFVAQLEAEFKRTLTSKQKHLLPFIPSNRLDQ